MKTYQTLTQLKKTYEDYLWAADVAAKDEIFSEYIYYVKKAKRIASVISAMPVVNRRAAA